MKLLWSSAIFGALLLAGTAADAAPRPARPKMVPNVPPYELTTMMWEFPTGLRVLLQEDHTHPIVSVFTVVDHGFNDDPEGKEETAHFVEHIWFRSVHGDWPPVMDVITGHTSLFNATTRADWTDYRTTMSNFYLEKLIALEGYRLSEPYRGVTEDQIAVEREVIRNEFRRRNEQDSAQLFNAIFKYVYPEGHPYHRHSSHESLTNIQLSDLQWYMDTFYQPSETTITIVGSFDPQEVMHYIFKHWDPKLLHPELTEDHRFFFPRPGIENPDRNNENHWFVGYWDPSAQGEKLLSVQPDNPLPPRISSTERREVPPPGTREVGQERLPVETTTAVIGWSLPGAYRDDHWELQLLGGVANMAVMSGLRSQYPEREVGDRIGTGSGCGTNPGLLNSTLFCFIEIKDSKLDPVNVAERALDQLAILWNPDYVVMFDQQLARARNEMIRDTLLSLDDVASVFGGRAEAIGIHAHYTGRPTYHSEAMNRIVSVDGRAVANLGFNYLTRDRAAMVIARPLGAEEMDTRNATSSYAGASEGDLMVDTTVDFVPDEVIADIYTTIDQSKMVDTQLDNGLRVVIMPHGEAPIVQASMIFGGGSAELPKGIHSFVAQFTESTGYDPLEIAGTTNYAVRPGWMGSSSAAWPMSARSVWRDGWRLEYKAPSGNLDGALWQLRGEIETLRPAMSGKSYWLKNHRQRMTRNFGSANWHASVARAEHLFPGSAVDAPTSWNDIETWKRWGGKTVREYLTSHIHPSNAALVIVGNIDANEALEIARKQFAGWEGKSGAPNTWVRHETKPAMPTAEARIQIFDAPKRTQTQVNMACRLDYEGPHQQPAVDILSSILGDQTFQTIRVEEGLAYSPGAFAYSRSDGAALLQFSSLTINTGVGRVVEFTRQAVERIKEGQAPAAEVQAHKLKLANAGGVDAHSVEQVTGYLSWPIREGRDWSVLTEAGQHIAAVSPRTLDDLVKSCLDHAIWQLHGPKDVIVPQLEEKGYAYEIVDWKAAGDALLWEHDPKAAKKKQQKDEQAKASDAGSSEESESEEG